MAGGPTLRVLCIADEYPWPADNGYRMRVANTVEALATIGDVDLFCTVSERPDLAGTELDPPVPVARLLVHHRPAFGGGVGQLPTWVRTRWPRAVAWRDWDLPARAMDAWAAPSYDLVWFVYCSSWLALGQDRRGPTVVDLVDLEDEKLRHAMRLARTGAEAGGRRSLTARARRAVGAALDRVDVGRWTRAQHRAAAQADAVTVTSELDRRRLGRPAVVIPNGYDLPAGAAPPAARSRPSDATFTMIGLMTYPPNADGARFFGRRVLPAVRGAVPGARFVVIGRDDGELADLAAEEGVEVLGRVDDLEPHLAETTAAVVPLRVGSGTRVKVLEAWAHRIPVVSTGLGCEGLDAVDGTHVLLGEDAASFADACVALADDPDLAAAVGSAGHDLWHDRFRWAVIRDDIAALGREVAAQ